MAAIGWLDRIFFRQDYRIFWITFPQKCHGVGQAERVLAGSIPFGQSRAKMLNSSGVPPFFMKTSFHRNLSQTSTKTRNVAWSSSSGIRKVNHGLFVDLFVFDYCPPRNAGIRTFYTFPLMPNGLLVGKCHGVGQAERVLAGSTPFGLPSPALKC